MTQLMALLTVLSCVFLAGCKTSVPRPDTNVYVVNVELMQMKGYNLLRDYDDNGKLLAGAKPSVVTLHDLRDLDKMVGTDPDGWANLKAYIKNLRAAEDQAQ